jgi:hypothetical protein
LFALNNTIQMDKLKCRKKNETNEMRENKQDYIEDEYRHFNLVFKRKKQLAQYKFRNFFNVFSFNHWPTGAFTFR